MIRLALACCLALLALAAHAADEPAAAKPGTPEFFTQRVRPLLQDQCLRCHGETRQKGDLKLNDRAAILKGGKHGPAMVVGDPEHSSMIVAVRYADEDLQMPPDGRLSDADVQALADWVATGAIWVHPDGTTEGGTSAPAPGPTSATPIAVAPAKSDADSRTTSDQEGGKQPPLIGRPHPAIIHFPIACLILALLAEFLVVARGPAWQPTVGLLVTVGVLGTIAAVLTGTFFGDGTMFNRPGRDLKLHELLGWLTMVLALAAGALLMASRSSPRARLYFRLALLAAAISIAITGHVGGMMSHPESAPF